MSGLDLLIQAGTSVDVMVVVKECSDVMTIMTKKQTEVFIF